LSVLVKWLAVKTASEMTYTVSGGALNSTQTSNQMLNNNENTAGHMCMYILRIR